MWSPSNISSPKPHPSTYIIICGKNIATPKSYQQLLQCTLLTTANHRRCQTMIQLLYYSSLFCFMFLAVSFLCLSPKKTVDVDPVAKLCFLLQDLCIVPCVDTDDMEKIQVYVRHALSFLHSVTHRGGRVLFLESLTTFGSTEILNKMLHELAEVLGAPNREGRCGKGWWESDKTGLRLI